MLDYKSFFREDRGSSFGVAGYLVWNTGQGRDYVSSAGADPALNKHPKKSWEGKQEGSAKAQDGCPLNPPPHCTSKDNETDVLKYYPEHTREVKLG